MAKLSRQQIDQALDVDEDGMTAEAMEFYEQDMEDRRIFFDLLLSSQRTPDYPGQPMCDEHKVVLMPGLEPGDPYECLICVWLKSRDLREEDLLQLEE